LQPLFKCRGVLDSVTRNPRPPKDDGDLREKRWHTRIMNSSESARTPECNGCFRQSTANNRCSGAKHSADVDAGKPVGESGLSGAPPEKIVLQSQKTVIPDERSVAQRDPESRKIQLNTFR
jgi:hypothetical protein